MLFFVGKKMLMMITWTGNASIAISELKKKLEFYQTLDRLLHKRQIILFNIEDPVT